MRIQASLGKEAPLGTKDYDDMPWFHAKLLPKQICIQDIVHLINKLKTRLFSISTLFPMGDGIFATAGDINIIAKVQLKINTI